MKLDLTKAFREQPPQHAEQLAHQNDELSRINYKLIKELRVRNAVVKVRSIRANLGMNNDACNTAKEAAT